MKQDIAVIGVAGRFPGAPDVETFWQNLRNGVESIERFTVDEREGDGASSVRASNYVPAKGRLDGVDCFDATFFDYSPEEARYLDPQFRLLHECVWEALEDAGYAPGCHDHSIALYAGAALNEWWMFRALGGQLSGDAATLDIAPLTLRDHLCSLVSYKLGLTGPSTTVQTAGSTSLVAIHQAVEALRAGECAIAVAGGVSISLPSKAGDVHREGRIHSPDGHCRPFDARAAGTVLGDGVGIVVLKRLDEAVADGDHLYAVIRGSAVNHDGHCKVNDAAALAQGQTAVIRAALAVADVPAESISYVEAHGTGAPTSDSAEVEALTSAYDSDARGVCWLGSVKSNIGNVNIAAGVSGFIKTALALRHRELPPTLHYEAPHPRLDLGSSPFAVVTERRDWTTDALPRRAGVSSFGIGGTNAHVILEEPPAPSKRPAPDRPALLLLSAKTEGALRAIEQRLARHLKAHPTLRLADVAYTLRVGRTAFPFRRALVCRSIEDAIARLSQRVDHFVPDPIDKRLERLQAEAAAWEGGEPIASSALVSEEAPLRRVSLPTYPFERLRFWLDGPAPRFALESDADPAALEDATSAASAAVVNQAPYVAPTTAIEARLCELWASVLGVGRCGIDEDFFEAGGNSLLAVKLEVAIETAELAGAGETIYTCPTPRLWAAKLEGREIAAVAAGTAVASVAPVTAAIQPFNHFIYKSCFYSAVFPVVEQLGRSVIPFLVNDLVVYSTTAGTLSATLEAVLPIARVLDLQGLELRGRVHVADVIADVQGTLREGRPALVRVDCFHESIRSDTFQKIHHPHTILVYGVDETKRMFRILEHTHRDSPLYAPMDLPFDDLQAAYGGFVERFASERGPTFVIEDELTYLELLGDPSWRPLSKAEMRATFFENVRSGRARLFGGLDVLERFADAFVELVDQPELLAPRVDALVAGFNQVIAAKRIEVFRLRGVEADEQLVRSAEEHLAAWTTIRAIVAKYGFSHRYVARSFENAKSSMRAVVRAERELVQRIAE